MVFPKVAITGLDLKSLPQSAAQRDSRQRILKRLNELRLIAEETEATPEELADLRLLYASWGQLELLKEAQKPELRTPFGIKIVDSLIQEVVDEVMSRSYVPQTVSTRIRVADEVARLLLSSHLEGDTDNFTPQAFDYADDVSRAVLDVVKDRNEELITFPGAPTRALRLRGVVLAMVSFEAANPDSTGVTLAVRDALLRPGDRDIDRSLLPAAREFLAQLDVDSFFRTGIALRQKTDPASQYDLDPQDFGLAMSQVLGGFFQTIDDKKDVRAGRTPIPTTFLPEPEPELRGSARERAVARATKKSGEFLDKLDALAIADSFLRRAGERYFKEGAFIDKAILEGRSKEEATREWKAFSSARDQYAEDILNASLATPGYLSPEEAAEIVVSAAEEAIDSFQDARTQSLTARSEAAADAAAKKELEDRKKNKKALVTAAIEDLGIDPKLINSQEKVNLGNTLIENGVLTPEDIGGAYFASLQAEWAEKQASLEGDATFAATALKDALHTAVSGLTPDDLSEEDLQKFRVDYVQLGLKIPTELAEEARDRKLSEGLRGKPGVAEERLTELLLEATGRGLAFLTDQRKFDLLQMIRGGTDPPPEMLVRAVAEFEGVEGLEKVRAARMAQESLNLAALEPLEVERLLEDIGIGRVGSTSAFQQQLRSLVVPQLIEFMEDARKVDPQGLIDFPEVARGFVGRGRFEGFADEAEFDRRRAAFDPDVLPPLPPDALTLPGLPDALTLTDPTVTNGLAPRTEGLGELFASGEFSEQYGRDVEPTRLEDGAEGQGLPPDMPPGVPPLPGLDAGIIEQSTFQKWRQRAGSPVVPEPEELRALIASIAGDDRLYQQFLLGNLESLLADVEKAGQADLEQRRAEAQKTAIALRGASQQFPYQGPLSGLAWHDVPQPATDHPGMRPPMPSMFQQPSGSGFTPEQAAAFAARPLSVAEFEPLFQEQIPTLQARFEESPEFIERRQRKGRRQQAALRGRHRTIFAGLA